MEPLLQVEAHEAVQASCLTKTGTAMGTREQGGPNFQNDETKRGADL